MRKEKVKLELFKVNEEDLLKSKKYQNLATALGKPFLCGNTALAAGITTVSFDLMTGDVGRICKARSYKNYSLDLYRSLTGVDGADYFVYDEKVASRVLSALDREDVGPSLVTALKPILKCGEFTVNYCAVQKLSNSFMMVLTPKDSKTILIIGRLIASECSKDNQKITADMEEFIKRVGDSIDKGSTKCRFIFRSYIKEIEAC